MADKKKASKAVKASNRTSISFPPELYRTLGAIAKQQKVSLAWVIRDAAEKYVKDRWPLLERAGEAR